jgi:hypothetical protein
VNQLALLLISAVALLGAGSLEAAPDEMELDAQTLRAISPAPGTVRDDEALELPRKENGHLEAEVIDLLHAAADPRMRRGVERETIDVLGQFASAGAFSQEGRRFKLRRIFTTCCEREARPVAVLIEAEKRPAFREGAWVKAVGRVEFITMKGRTLALVKASSVTAAEKPEGELSY